jgi:hypothetical protein
MEDASANIGIALNIVGFASAGTASALETSFMKSANGWNHGGPILFWNLA